VAGYSGISMSNNAVKAYSEGKVPLSKITRKKLNQHGITISVDMFKYLCKIGVFEPCEWHHTSMDYNMTNFYDLEQAAKKLPKLDLDRWSKDYKAQKKATKHKEKDNIINYAYVSYDVPSGLGKKRRYYTREDYAVILNGWAYLVSGSKKNINGKRFWIKKQFTDRPEQVPESLAAEVSAKIK